MQSIFHLQTKNIVVPAVISQSFTINRIHCPCVCAITTSCSLLSSSASSLWISWVSWSISRFFSWRSAEGRLSSSSSSPSLVSSRSSCSTVRAETFSYTARGKIYINVYSIMYITLMLMKCHFGLLVKALEWTF